MMKWCFYIQQPFIKGATVELKEYDYVIIGSGFGASVSAMRLAEKGYSVLVLDKGKRYRDQDFAKSNLSFWKYLWIPPLRSFGILQISLLKGMMVLHGTGVGGGSLGYANVLEIPTDETFATPAWQEPMPWSAALRPHFTTARKMLGAVHNPKLWAADETLKEIATELGEGATFRPTEVGVYFGTENETAPDPFFDGTGPELPAANFVAGAWSVAVTTPKIPCQKTTCISRRNMERECLRSKRCWR